jgi:hypothetical protein
LKDASGESAICRAGKKIPGSKKVLDIEDLSGMFGIDIAEEPAAAEKVKPPAQSVAARKPTRKKPKPRKPAIHKSKEPGIPAGRSSRPAKKKTRTSESNN